ncbi:hypothetical protein DFS34DRAFT_233744 [Phlyctochytrium arcticum]|nr:hypothetical protein DFS34DRAFT_233744 [Phlyctochytrium arcticum]
MPTEYNPPRTSSIDPERDIPNLRARQLRSILLKSIRNAGPVEAILLSGGLDTSILADAGSHILKCHKAITVICSDSAPDKVYATRIAAAHGFRHTILKIDMTDLISDAPGGDLEYCIRTLKTFDPMELRNAVIIAAGIRAAARMGIKKIVTGDGADELFAGYSFMAGMSAGKLRRFRERMVAHMRFCAGELGRGVGVDVVQPFLGPEVVEFALTCKKSENVKVVNVYEGDLEAIDDNDALSSSSPTDKPITTQIQGKSLLRAAFPESHSRNRRKDPIETGSGSSLLPSHFASLTPLATLTAAQSAILSTDKIKIRDAEHLYYYQTFCRVFERVYDSQGGMCFQGLPDRWTADPCIGCGFNLDRADQYFCKTCGAWPAREGGVPNDSYEGDEVDQ